MSNINLEANNCPWYSRQIFALLSLTADAPASDRSSRCHGTGPDSLCHSQGTLQDGYRLLSGPEIAKLVSDHTVEGHYGANGRKFVDYFAPDGRVSTIEPGDLQLIGTWTIEGNLLCFTYPTGKGKFPKCVEVAAKDGHFVEFWMREPHVGALGAELTSFTPGNVKNLPLE